MSKTKPVIASADIYWANLEKKNEMSGKYQVDLCNLSETAVNALEEMGITLKSNPKKPEMGQYITSGLIILLETNSLVTRSVMALKLEQLFHSMIGLLRVRKVVALVSKG